MGLVEEAGLLRQRRTPAPGGRGITQRAVQQLAQTQQPLELLRSHSEGARKEALQLARARRLRGRCAAREQAGVQLQPQRPAPGVLLPRVLLYPAAQ